MLYAMTPGASYQWLDCSNNMAPITGATQITFTPATTGNYALQVTDSGCIAVSPCFFVVGTGIERVASLDDIKYYPNPTTEKLVIEASLPLKGFIADIYDPVGRIVRTVHLATGKQYTLDISGPDGLYFISISDKDGNQRMLKVLKKSQ